MSKKEECSINIDGRKIECVGKEKKVKIGTVGVDTASLLIADPEQLDNIKQKHPDLWYEMMQKGAKTKKIGTQLRYPLGHAGMGVILHTTGMGDGSYNVYAIINELKNGEKRVTRLEIDFIDCEKGEKVSSK